MPAILSPRPRPARALRPHPAPTPRLMSPIELCPRQIPSRSARRRQCRPYPDRRPSTTFDQLPWISALDAPPDICNIADLSQIPDPRTTHKRTPRQTPDLVPCTPLFLRSSTPLPPTTPIPPSSPGDTSSPSSRPHTPRPRFHPSRVLFHHLMPVLRRDSHNDEPAEPPCALTITPLR